MPKTSQKSTKPRKEPSQTRVGKKTLGVQAKPSGGHKQKYFISAVILSVTAAVILQIINSKQTQKDNGPQQSASTFEATQEAKLIEIYEKEKNVDLNKNFVPRYSVFQDDIIGFKIAYPVGFTTTSTDTGVLVTPTSGKGSITLTVINGNGDFKTNTSGLSAKESEILNAAADFVKSTFVLTSKPSHGSQELQKRFSQGNENVKPY